MSNKARKRIWSMSLVMSLAIIGALAAFIVLANDPGSTAAHGGEVENHCDDLATEGSSLQNSEGGPGTTGWPPPPTTRTPARTAAETPTTPVARTATPTAAAMKQFYRRWSAAAAPAALPSSSR